MAIDKAKVYTIGGVALASLLVRWGIKKYPAFGKYFY